MTKDLNLEAVNSALSREVRKLQELLKEADKRNAELVRIVRLGAMVCQLQADSMSKPQLDIDTQAALKKAEDDFVASMRPLELVKVITSASEPSMPDLDPDRLMIDPPSGWRYGFPKRIPREHQHRTVEWMIEQGYPRQLTEEKHFYIRYWNATEET